MGIGLRGGIQPLRLFIAINLPNSERERIHRISSPLRAAGLPVRWVDPASYHVTLEFLGERSADQIPALQGAMARALAGRSCFSLELGHFCGVPALRRPRVLWLEIDGGSVLQQIHAHLRRTLSECGFAPEDRAFRPHLTLGRVRKNIRPRDFARLPELTEDLDFEATLPVDSVDLMRSDLSERGARYSLISRCDLERPESNGEA